MFLFISLLGSSLMLLFISILVLFLHISFKVLVLGFSLFLLSLFMFFILVFQDLVWFSLLFFLVYMGGLLVIFCYVLTLNCKPNLKASYFFDNFYYWSLLALFSICGFLNSYFSFQGVLKSVSFQSSEVDGNSYYFFSLNELFLVLFMVIFLTYTLYVVSLLVSVKKGSLRATLLA